MVKLENLKVDFTRNGRDYMVLTLVASHLFDARSINLYHCIFQEPRKTRQTIGQYIDM